MARMWNRVWKEQVMKRAFLVILSLSICTVAQAAIGFVPTKTTVNVGETITINLISDAGCYGFTIDLVTDGGKGGICSDLSFNSSMTVISAGYIENAYMNEPEFYPVGMYILFSYAAAYAPISPCVAGAPVFSFKYTADSILGPVTITPYAYDGGIGPCTALVGSDPTPQEITGCTITVVPEPMTVALLGLGGLWLRRKMA
jgi:hypothetical protein